MTLRGSDSPCKGRLEVRRDSKGPWGLVCHYGWNPRNAEVVCKSLMCGKVLTSSVEMTLYKDSHLPKIYLMDQVSCKSNETSLWNCQFYARNDLQCVEHRFVAVECSGR